LQTPSPKQEEKRKASKEIFAAFTKNYKEKFGRVRGAKKAFAELMYEKARKLDGKHQQVVNWSNVQGYKEIPLQIFDACVKWNESFQ
jgi:hypothetical protein